MYIGLSLFLHSHIRPHSSPHPPNHLCNKHCLISNKSLKFAKILFFVNVWTEMCSFLFLESIKRGFHDQLAFSTKALEMNSKLILCYVQFCSLKKPDKTCQAITLDAIEWQISWKLLTLNGSMRASGSPKSAKRVKATIC